MSTVDYEILDPSGNVTVLADRPKDADPADLADLAALVMAKEEKAEQMGYVSGFAEDAPELYMAGGEFCGNASMAACALYAKRKGCSEVKTELKVSGAAEKLPVTAEKSGEAYRCSVGMPKADAVKTADLLFEGMTYRAQSVIYPGITHLVFEGLPMEKAKAEAAVKFWCKELNAAGLGLQFYDKRTGILTPLVFVPGIPSLVWESSCASGTAALGEVLLRKNGPFSRIEVREPGGTLGLTADKTGRIFLDGTVKFAGSGSAPRKG